MVICHDHKQYNIGDLVAETEFHRLYLCSQEGNKPENLFQIATDLTHNGRLDRAAYFLGILLEHAEKLEWEYSNIKNNPKHMLNYHLCFPGLVDSFVLADQGDRRANIIKFREIDNVRSMVPLHNVVHRDKRRVDLRTSVWIAGKLLKVLIFAHNAGISVGDISLGNVLIEPDRHYVVVFNWANARKHDVVSKSIIRDEIRSVAICATEVLGGTNEHPVPDDGSDQYERYTAYIADLASNGAITAEEAHHKFYKLVDELWPHGFYPFTTLPLSR